MKKVTTLQAPQQQYTEGEKLAQKFPNIFNHLRRDTTYMNAQPLWEDMKQAGITEQDLPAMEAAVQMPGFARIEQFKMYWK